MNQFFSVAKNLLFTIKYYKFIKFNFDFLNVAPTTIVSFSLPTMASGSFSPTSINELMQDGILWGVPKKRRNIERRLKRRFGVENYLDNSRILQQRNDIIVCERCGEHHEYYTICPTCYRKVKEETDRIRQAIKQQIDPLKPKEKEILLKYKGEQESSYNSKRDLNKFQIIDIDQPRPQWFSENLMTKSAGTDNYAPKDVIMNPRDLIIDNNKK